jgi:hypothetical protein
MAPIIYSKKGVVSCSNGGFSYSLKPRQAKANLAELYAPRPKVAREISLEWLLARLLPDF